MTGLLLDVPCCCDFRGAAKVAKLKVPTTSVILNLTHVVTKGKCPLVTLRPVTLSKVLLLLVWISTLH